MNQASTSQRSDRHARGSDSRNNRGNTTDTDTSTTTNHTNLNTNANHTRHTRRVSPAIGRIMLLTVALGWGCGYTFSGFVLDTMPLQWMMAFRLFPGAICVGAIAFRRIRSTPVGHVLAPGVLLGVSYWMAYLVQMTGLRMTAPGRNAFLTATYCVTVPFIAWALTRRRPAARNVVAAAVCLVGIGFISLSGGGGGVGSGAGVGSGTASTVGAAGLVNVGDLVSVAGGVLFGLNIALTGLLARDHDAMALTFYEFVSAGILFVIGAILVDGPIQPGWFAPRTVWSLLYVIAVSTVIAQVFQNVAFGSVPTSQGSLIMCLESVFGVICSTLITGEEVTLMTMIGFVLVFASLVLSEVRLRSRGAGLVTESGRTR